LEAASKLVPKKAKRPSPRIACYRDFYCPETGEHIDSGLVLYFPGPNSSTGLDVVELHTHGSPAVIKKMLSSLSALSSKKMNLAPALPGEFTQQAITAGKLSFLEAESLASLLACENEAERKMMKGKGFGDTVNKWRRNIENILVKIEGDLEIGHEEELPQIDLLPVISTLQEVKGIVRRSLDSTHSLGTEIGVAIVGPPNSGKSTLMNFITASDISIVTNVKGTTRDMIKAKINIDSQKIELIDTPGIRTDTQDQIEKIGIQRAMYFISIHNL